MPRSILVSSDDVNLAQTLSVAAQGQDVVIAYEVQPRFLERTRADLPHAVIIDVQQREWLETLCLLKTERATRSIPVVVIANDETLEWEEMALEAGADAFWAPPLADDFMATVLDLAGRAETRALRKSRSSSAA